MKNEIDERFLKTGLRIQNDAINALSLLSKEEDKLRSINEKLLSVTTELQGIKDKSMNYDSPESMKDDVFKQLQDIEVQSQILNKVIDPLNKKMERLRKEEEILWETIKEKYPNMEEENIVKQFTSYIEKNQ